MGDIYVLHCADVEDMEGLLGRSTATLDGAIMVFAKWYPNVVPRTVRFPFAEVWVRVCGLPFEYLNMDVGRVAGKLLSPNFVGEPFDMVPENDYLSLRVCIKLNEPLMPGFFLAMDGGYLLWVQFRYEEIFKYCIRCGKVGHKGSQCREGIMTIVSSVNRMLDRTQDRGFVVFQSQSNHTMFNMDLRATPPTSKYVDSRVRLRNGRINRERRRRASPERVIDFELGITPGGRVLPGMTFAVTAQPFAGPVIFQIGGRGGVPTQGSCSC
ncbi:uncharacterized protein LOC141628535 [Silene latifolia]|uniref:uncharacterized protein LOC141628535 n=1 Tax=Silene latifolia TaxID=37657 RepID=UPI003D783147